MDAYVSKAVTPFYSTPSSPDPLTTIEAFQQAATLSPRAAVTWLNKLDNIDESSFASVFNELPNEYASELAVKFAQKILKLNKIRLLALRETFI